MPSTSFRNIVSPIILGIGLSFIPQTSHAQKITQSRCDVLLNATNKKGETERKIRDEQEIIADLNLITEGSNLDESEKLYSEALKKLGFDSGSLGDSWTYFMESLGDKEAGDILLAQDYKFYYRNKGVLITQLEKSFLNFAHAMNDRIRAIRSSFMLDIHSRRDIVPIFLLEDSNIHEILEKSIDMLQKGKISHEYFEKMLDCYGESLNQYLDTKYKIFPSPNIFLNGSQNTTGLEGYESVLSSLQNEGILHRLYNKEIFFYTQDDLFLTKLDTNDQKLGEQLLSLLEANKQVPLRDYVTLLPQKSINIGLEITHEESIQAIEVQKRYAQLFHEYSQKGFKFIVEESKINKVRILALYGDNVVADVQNELPQAFDFFFKTLSKYENKEKKKLEYRISPDSLKLQFIDSVYNTWIGTHKEFPKLMDIVSIAHDMNIGGQEAFILALNFYISLNGKNFTIYDYIASSPELFFLSWNDILNKYNINLKDYGRLREAYLSYFYTLVNQIIQKNKNISPSIIISIIESVYKMDFNRGVSDNITQVRGVPSIIVNILRTALSNNPQLFNTPEMEQYFTQFPQLKALLSSGQATRVAHNQIMSGSHGGTGLDLANAVQIGGESDIFLRIRDMKIPRLKGMTEKAILEIKLSIARNLAIKNMDDIESFFIKFDAQREKIIQKELVEIFEARKSIFTQFIFKDKAVLHLAHYGQGIDAFGTPGTQEALKKQAKNGSYKLFDAQELKGKKGPVKTSLIRSFYHEFIENPIASVVLAEGHANANGFLILDDFSASDKLEIIKQNHSKISLDPVQLADIIIKRSKFRKTHNLQEKDIFIFAACKGDYVMNVIAELNKRKNEYEKIGIDPPIIITAAEAGENSIFNPGNEIPYEILRVALRIGEPNATTFGTLFQHQHREMSSNPGVFYPINGIYRQLF